MVRVLGQRGESYPQRQRRRDRGETVGGTETKRQSQSRDRISKEERKGKQEGETPASEVCSTNMNTSHWTMN